MSIEPVILNTPNPDEPEKCLKLRSKFSARFEAKSIYKVLNCYEKTNYSGRFEIARKGP